MQAGRRSSHGAARLGVHGLISLSIAGFVGTADIRRQGHVSEAIDGSLDRAGTYRQADASEAVSSASEYLSFELTFTENQNLTRTNLAPRPHQRLPGVLAFLACEEQFNLGGKELVARGIALADGLRGHSAAPAQEPRRKDLGVVEHQQVAGAENLRQLTKDMILEPLRGAVDDEQARSAAFGERMLGNQRAR